MKAIPSAAAALHQLLNRLAQSCHSMTTLHHVLETAVATLSIVVEKTTMVDNTGMVEKTAMMGNTLQLEINTEYHANKDIIQCHKVQHP